MGTKDVGSTHKIIIPIEIGENYQVGLRRRLQEYGITHREVAAEMGIDETQFSRWVGRPSVDTGEPMDLRLSSATKIEAAIIAIRLRKKRSKGK